MDIMNFSNLESQVLSSFNEGNRTFDTILDNLQINNKSLNTVIEGLIAKNIFTVNKQTGEYVYQSKIEGDLVILDGNILLPTTILKLENKLLICRGEWYEFPLDFDVRRIIWNVKLENKTNSTLVDLIQNSVLKAKKSRLVQLPEYENLKNKVVPYSPKIGLSINCVGEGVTDINIIFKIFIDDKSDISAVHQGFSVQSEISTDELITQLKLPVDQRNYVDNIKLNHIFNFSDFIFSNNEIPVSITKGKLSYIKITGIRKGFELSYYDMDITGKKQKLTSDFYDETSEAIETLRDIFKGLPSLILSESNFTSELTE